MLLFCSVNLFGADEGAQKILALKYGSQGGAFLVNVPDGCKITEDHLQNDPCAPSTLRLALERANLRGDIIALEAWCRAVGKAIE